MNKKGPPEHTRFKPGQSGNPGGKPKVSKELAAITSFNDAEMRKIISKYFRMDRPGLIEAGNSETLSSIELVIARALYEAARKGDLSKIMPLIERVCGRVKIVAEEENTERAEIAQMPLPVLLQLIKQAIPEMK
jgi:hypothetical protein